VFHFDRRNRKGRTADVSLGGDWRSVRRLTLGSLDPLGLTKPAIQQRFVNANALIGFLPQIITQDPLPPKLQECIVSKLTLAMEGMLIVWAGLSSNVREKL
jgi:hypothetical protein